MGDGLLAAQKYILSCPWGAQNLEGAVAAIERRRFIVEHSSAERALALAACQWAAQQMESGVSRCGSLVRMLCALSPCLFMIERTLIWLLDMHLCLDMIEAAFFVLAGSKRQELCRLGWSAGEGGLVRMARSPGQPGKCLGMSRATCQHACRSAGQL